MASITTKHFTFLLNFLVIKAVVSTTDFCSEEICGKGVKHIACGHSGNFDSSCPRNAEMVTMSNDLKQVLLDAHNVKRNFVAGGGYSTLEPACRMTTMEWDDELSNFAALNVKQCKMDHDKCHNTKDFKFSGQNLAWISFYGDFEHADKLNQIVAMWYDEVKNIKQEYIDSFPRNFYGLDIGHFTVMMADHNIRLGCAASTYNPTGIEHMHVYLVACNYATTNLIGFPIYEKCKEAASSCKTGINPNYINLCSTSEEYVVNKWL